MGRADHHGGAELIVRLYGINCPERYDPYGPEAGAFTGDAVMGRAVRLLTRGLDKYGRTLAFVLTGERETTRSLQRELLRAGLAQVYAARFRPASDETYDEYKRVQAAAMLDGRGMWGKRKGR